MTPATLFAALGAIPALPGALCRGLPDLWAEIDPRVDPAEESERVAYALRACRRCPALDDCREWIGGLKPSQRPPGVVAGVVTQ